MSSNRSRPALGSVLIFAVLAALGGYFAFAAIQGNHGVLRQTEARAETAELRAERAAREAELARIENLNRRLSDDYLDLELLDERVRDVLGYIRPDETVLP